MKGDFSRVSFDPLRRFSAVLQQQGRVQLDSDFNEQGAILLHHLRTLAADLIGPHGGPEGAFRVSPVCDESGALRDLEIAPGHYYVNGILCENGVGVRFSDQPDRTDRGPLPEPPFLVYLDVWERYVSAVEDPSLSDPALGGADTAGRARVAWQVMVLPHGSCESIAALAARNRGHMRCTTPDGYHGEENQLYRVEIHRGGPAGTATFKWARDNGSTACAVAAVEGARLELSCHLGDLRPGDIVEVQHDVVALGDESDPPPLLTVEEVEPKAALVTLSDEVREVPMPPTLVRRWEGSGALATGTWIDLEDGVQVLFEEDGAGYRSGDYWLIPARTATGAVIWPADDQGEPAARRPDGVDHHLAPLALLQREDKRVLAEDCRREFAPAARPATAR